MKDQTYYTVEYLDEIGGAGSEDNNLTLEQVEKIKQQSIELEYEIRVIKQSGYYE